jgi:hypothetical protein
VLKGCTRKGGQWDVHPLHGWVAAGLVVPGAVVDKCWSRVKSHCGVRKVKMVSCFKLLYN